MSDATVRPPKAYRLMERALVAGVSAGLAAHSRIPVWLIRIAFVVTSAWKFSGAIAYAVLWLVLPRERKPLPIGLVAAERQGFRTPARPPRWPLLAGWAGLLVAGYGVSWVMSLYDTSVIGRYATYICVLGWGIGLVWLAREINWPRWAKFLLGLAGIVVAWVSGTFGLGEAVAPGWLRLGTGVPSYVGTFVIGGAVIAGCALVALPWFLHPGRPVEVRQAELIAETRADMAAHLHDSVLQTLAVIQKQAGDARAVAQLARRQERELREWLYAEHVDEESAGTALKEVVAELEATYPVAIELVTVGDHEMTVEVDALVRAAREAILNAAKHSGADQVDVYAEIRAGLAEVFVRDRGRGFSMADIGDDRMGIRGSIIERMGRYGGKVDIRSTPGEGTEIHLEMPLDEEGVQS